MCGASLYDLCDCGWHWIFKNIFSFTKSNLEPVRNVPVFLCKSWSDGMGPMNRILLPKKCGSATCITFQLCVGTILQNGRKFINLGAAAHVECLFYIF